MLPRTQAGYAAIVLTLLSLAVNTGRVVLLLLDHGTDPALTLAGNSTLTAAVAALVWLVHQNGNARP